MKKELAIKGHKTRGKEVIEILQMLGGGKTVYSGTDKLCIYFLNKSKNITVEFYEDKALTHLSFEVLTLEEFLEKFPFKINDRVINSDYSGTGIITEMAWDCNNRGVKYCVKFDDFGLNVWFNRDEINLIETELFREDNIDPLHELCENKLPTLMINSEVCDDEVELILDGYEIEVRDGKTFAVKKKPKYPTTYEECCDVLKIPKEERYIDIDVPLSYNNLLYKFTELLICRDAYWKIAGEQMGLSGPWEPDWGKSDSGYVYCIVNKCNNIGLTCEWLRNNYILAFPTVEMRDAFFENFTDLIEKCKELL